MTSRRSFLKALSALPFAPAAIAASPVANASPAKGGMLTGEMLTGFFRDEDAGASVLQPYQVNWPSDDEWDGSISDMSFEWPFVCTVPSPRIRASLQAFRGAPEAVSRSKRRQKRPCCG